MPSRVSARASWRSTSTSCSRMSRVAWVASPRTSSCRSTSRWLTEIARSPVLTRYSKSPDFEYSPQVRRELLRQSRQNNAAQIGAGLRWLENLAGAQSAVAARGASGGRMTDVAALTTLGRRHAGWRWHAAVARERLSRRCAMRPCDGSGEAAALLSVCAAWGVAQARNVDAALDHLARAAELGWSPALRELQLLARDSVDDPAALRRKVDVAVAGGRRRRSRRVRKAAHRRCRALCHHRRMPVAHRSRCKRGTAAREGLSQQLDALRSPRRARTARCRSRSSTPTSCSA